MNEADLHSFTEKHEDQVLAKVLLAWRLLTPDAVREAYKEMQQLQSAGQCCKLGQVLIKKRIIQIADYTKAMQVTRQQLQILYQRNSQGSQAQGHVPPTQQLQAPFAAQQAPTYAKLPPTQELQAPPKPRTAPHQRNSTQRRKSRPKRTTAGSRRKQHSQKKAYVDDTEITRPAVSAEEDSTMAFPNSDEQPSLGKRFGSYEVICEIARGGMGIVYKARQHPLNRIVALKVLLSGGAASEIEIERFRREAEAAGALQHPNIVSIYEIGEQEGYHYFTMDFIEGVTLQDMIKKKTRMKKMLQIMEKVALALEHAHQREVIHRDIKPSNLLVSNEGEPKITDFGLAKKLDANTMLTESGAALGTPFYMAPEQTLGSKDVDARVDIYAMGIILYEILAGRLPFAAETLVDLYRKIVEEDPSPPSKFSRKVDKEIETICLKAMEKDPKLRYQTAQEMGEDLHRYLTGKNISARRTSVIYRLQRKIKRSRQKLIVIGGITVVFLSLVFFVFLKMTETSEQEKKLEKVRMLQKEGEVLEKNGDYDGAMEKWNEAIRIQPQFIKPYLARGDTYQKRQQYLNAIGEYERILQREPGNALAYFKKGNCYSALNQWDKSIEHYTKALDALENKPNRKLKIDIYHKRGIAYQKRDREDDWQHAITDFNKEENLKKEKR